MENDYYISSIQQVDSGGSPDQTRELDPYKIKLQGMTLFIEIIAQEKSERTKNESLMKS